MIEDVVVVGSGPTGLMLAAELRLGGARPIVLERLPAPTGLSKALGIVGRAVQMLDYRGLLGGVEHDAHLARYAHFAGIRLNLTRLSGGPVPFLGMHQAQVEAMLDARATELGVEIRRGHEVTDLRQDEGYATLEVRGPDGAYPLRARFVVGCDGGHSVVRKRAEIGFPGQPPNILLRLADVTVPDGVMEPGHLVLPSGRRVPFGLAGVSAVPLGDGFCRVVTREPYPAGFDRTAPMTLDELASSLRKLLGEDLPITGVRWLSRFTDASRQADRYRAGRVFVAGDAAHVHLPAGGPGLNTCLQDAVNLGWKLAAEIRGGAPSGLLYTYHAERHPEGARVLLHTRAQSALMIDDPRIASLRTILGDLLQHEQAIRHLAELMYTLDVRYEMTEDDTAARHPLLGRWVPDLALTTAQGPTRVAEQMRGARGVLLDLAHGAASRGVQSGWGDRVDVLVARCDSPPAPADALLVRPDGYVAWASPVGGSPESAQQGLHRALSAWFGEARAA